MDQWAESRFVHERGILSYGKGLGSLIFKISRLWPEPVRGCTFLALAHSRW